MALFPLWNAVPLCLVLWWLANKIRLRVFYDLHRLPTAPQELPFLGHLFYIPLYPKARFTQCAMENTLNLGKIWRYSIMGKDSIVVTEREFLSTNIYGSREKTEPKSHVYSPLTKLFSCHGIPSLFTYPVADEKHKSFRKTLAVAFSSDNLKKHFPSFLQEAHKFADIVNKSVEMKSIDYQHLGVRFAFDNIGHFAYNGAFDSLKIGHPLLTALSFCADECMVDVVNPIRPLAKAFLPFLKISRKNKEAFQILYKEYHKLYDNANLVGNVPGDDDKSTRACLMRLRNPLRNNQKATQGELMTEFIQFMVAGTDTTGHQIGWTMMWIADNREIQDKIYSELKVAGLAGIGARELEFSDLPKLPYLKMVVLEALRMTPAGSALLSRTLCKDMTIMGYRIPKGTLVGACVQTQNNVPWLWKDPKVFKPERWAKENSKEREGESGEGRGGKELWTFGTGIRDCIGRRLATLEIELLIAVLLSKFTFELDPRMGGMDGALKKSYDSLVAVCEGGAWVKAARRPFDTGELQHEE